MPDAGIARRFIHLIHGLRPSAGSFSARHLTPLPLIVALVLNYLCRLVLPVLPPVLGHHRFADRTVLLDDSHIEDVYEADEGALVLVDVHTFGAPGLVRTVAFGAGLEGFDLQKIERHPVAAGHRKNSPPVALKRRQSVRPQCSPRRRGDVSGVMAGPRVDPPRGVGAELFKGQVKV